MMMSHVTGQVAVMMRLSSPGEHGHSLSHCCRISGELGIVVRLALSVIAALHIFKKIRLWFSKGMKSYCACRKAEIRRQSCSWDQRGKYLLLEQPRYIISLGRNVPQQPALWNLRRKITQGADIVLVFLLLRYVGKNCPAPAKNEPKAGEVAKSLGVCAQSLSHVQLFAIPCSPPGSSVRVISQARILE